MDFTVWLTFVAASTALLMIPGPTVLLVMAFALSSGRRVALATAAGVAAGDLVAMTASLLGLGALVLASATAFTVLKWVGAVYLVWLGIKLLRAPAGGGIGAVARPDASGARAILGHAATVTALNPKSIAFFIAFVPQFIDPARPLGTQFAILIATFVTLAALNAVLYALAADQLRTRSRRPAVLRWLNRGGGAALIGMGVLSAMARRGT